MLIDTTTRDERIYLKTMELLTKAIDQAEKACRAAGVSTLAVQTQRARQEEAMQRVGKQLREQDGDWDGGRFELPTELCFTLMAGATLMLEKLTKRLDEQTELGVDPTATQERIAQVQDWTDRLSGQLALVGA